MFTIFKKNKEQGVTIVGAGISGNRAPASLVASYPKDVLEIHNEFNTAADKLLLEANSIISEAASKDTQKVSRLEALGFKKVSQVVELKPLMQLADFSKEQVDFMAIWYLITTFHDKE